MVDKRLKREEINLLSKKEKLDYFMNLNDDVKIATGNTKLGNCICALSFPAGVTCRKDAPCRKECYCMKGNQITSSVLGTYMKNYRIWQEDSKKFFKQIDGFLKSHGYKYMRIFDSGDIPSTEFLIDLTKKVVNKNKRIKFLMYTKQYEIVNSVFNEEFPKPKNFTIVFSTWDKSWGTEKIEGNYPKSYIDFKDKERNVKIPQKHIECSGNCSKCLKCWKLKDNECVVFHQH